ncbi:class I SAM-dependent methyltransferase [Falsiroseomonas sp. HW251]|uniref:class I SAM-dependent methyltransferase n=1 Tax=Falsiroseomonas sp. HW251 TaxID=3390998 RepID=UPI003D30FD46
MGEIFERPLPAVGLPFTGERLTSEFGGQTEIEHLHRYLLARHLCRGRRVLDIAAGEGYGSAMIAQVATQVIGVELAADVVEHARANYRRDNLEYRVGDAREIPVEDASVDVVVSFETIEHFTAHDRFLDEIRRVLRPGGLLVVSTPDRDNYSPADQPANPFHALEMTRPEFASLLQARFAHVGMWWQRPMIGSALMPGPEAPAVPGSLCFERRGERHFEASAGYARPLYLVALCSDAALPEVPPSVYIDTTAVNARDTEARAAVSLRETLRVLEATLLDERGEMVRLRQDVRQLESENAAMRASAAELEAENAAMRASAAQLEAEHAAMRASSAELEAENVAMRASTSWRITWPVRAAARLLRGGGR